MDSIEIGIGGGESRIIEPFSGKGVNIIPKFLGEHEDTKDILLSEGYTRLLGVRNFENAPELIYNSWYTSDLIATKGNIVKVILPYNTKGRLTGAEEFALGLIDSNGESSNYIDLDIDDRWDKIEGSGVYIKSRDEWFRKREDGSLIGLNEDMTIEQAMRCPIHLIIMGDSRYVDSKFARGTALIEETINETFRLGEQEFGYKTMMGKYLPEVSDNAVMVVGSVSGLENKARSDSRINIKSNEKQFLLYRKTN